MLSTDTDLSDEEIVRICGKRWDIEVFFKMAKQHLKLAKEIQCRDFDALIAHTTIVFMRYMFLAYQCFSNLCQSVSIGLNARRLHISEYRFFRIGPKNLSSKCGRSEFLLKGWFLLATVTRSTRLLLANLLNAVLAT
jgi:hypothetical protein